MAKSNQEKTKTKKKETRETPARREARRISRTRDIVMASIIAVGILIIASFFADGLNWLLTAVDFLFGYLKYPFPLLLIVFTWIFMYHDLDSTMVTRIVGIALILFSLAGIFTMLFPETSIGHTGGGIIGQGNRALLYGVLGTAGTYIVDILLIFIGVILVSDFSLFSFLSEKTDPKSEKNQRRREVTEERRRIRALEKENEELERQQKLHYDLEDQANEKRMRREQLEKSKNDREAWERRMSIKTGITDTLLLPDDDTEDTEDSGTVFFSGNGEDEAKIRASQGEKVFAPNIHMPEEFGTENGNNDGDTEPFFDQSKEQTEPFFDQNKEQTETGSSSEYVKTVITRLNSGIDSVKKQDTFSKEGADDSGDFFEAKEGKDSGFFESSEKEQPKDFFEAMPPQRGTLDDDENILSAPADQKPEKPLKEYKFPPLRLLTKGGSAGTSRQKMTQELQEMGMKLQKTLETFGINVKVNNISCGPTVTRFEIQPELGVKVSQIVALQNDIKLNLAAADIRMEAPIPGKSAIGIEIPNKVKQAVVLRDMLESDAFKNSKAKIPFVLGRDIEGNVIVPDLAKMPHLLIAGTTGSGKSVCLNTMIVSLLYHFKPTELKLLMIDPKVVELSAYNGIPHLIDRVITNPRKAAGSLAWAVNEMDKRYASFAANHVNNIESYNEHIENDHPVYDDGTPKKKMTKIVVIIDELADLMMTSPKEVEDYVCRLAQKARAAGIHIVIATQSPRVNVITGLIKANVPSRIALTVASGTDSRVIIDMNGAEKLVGNGDMLFAPAGLAKPTRIQGAFVSEEEVNDIISYITSQGKVTGSEEENPIDFDKAVQTVNNDSDPESPQNDFDEYFPDCARLIIESQKASISMLQRRFKLGFNRAARIMDQLSDAGVVGPENATKAREILMSMEEFESFLRGNS